MKGFITTILMCFSIFGLGAQEKAGFRSVGALEFAEYASTTEVVLLDVRTSEEHEEGCIPGTDLNIDVLDSSFKDEALRLIPEGSKVALYCRSGNRSKSASRILASCGYEVVELGSGYRGWVSAGRPSCERNNND